MMNKTARSCAMFVAISAFNQAAWTNDDTCTVVTWDEKSFNNPYIPIRKPGKYCIDRDYHFICYPWSHSCKGEIIDIDASDVDLDLKGHKLSSTNTSAYIGVRAKGKNITIRRGKISGMGRGVMLHSSDAHSYSTNFFRRDAIEKNKRPASGNFLIENLDVITDKQLGWWAIQSSAANVVLKNNRIIGTVLIHGPDAVLEGNRIQLDARDYDPNQRVNFRYGLIARNADNLRIIGNTFGILGDRTETTAIAIWDTQNATVTDNRIYGATTPIQIDNSTAEQRDNKTGLW